MKVPLLDLQAQYAPLRDELREAALRVLDSQQFMLGPDVKALEEEIESYTGAKHAIACASGSDAQLFPEAELAARATIALPIYPELTAEQQSYVVESIRNFVF